MRKRIRAIAMGKFEYEKPKLLFSENTITFSVIEGEDYVGEFLIESSTSVRLRGLVYSTHPRMEVLTRQFEGEKVRIRYQFKSCGLSEGLTEKGSFVIICEQNEISLSFCASISRKYAQSSIGSVKNLYDFSCLAKANWMEAYQLFYHRNFSNIIKPNELKESMIYRGIISAKPSSRNLEEFLIGICKKEKIHFSVERQQVVLSGIRARTMESVEIKKEHWGYLEIKASADAAFVQIEKKRICSEDFIGSTYHFEFYIDPAYMHAGRNFAKIELASAYESVILEITASTTATGKKADTVLRMERKKCLAGLMELYQAYRLKWIVTGVWTNETIALLERLHQFETEEVIYVLMKAHALIINRQKQAAEWILGDFKREWTDKTHPLWGYYLYLKILLEKEPRYVERLAGEIENIFHEHPDSAMLFWVRMSISEEYRKDCALKLKDIADWVMQGYTSPYLYVEGFYLILQNPYLLMDLGDFEMRILRWAVRHQALTKDIAIRIFQIMETKKGFHKMYYELMCAAFKVNPKDEYVGIICSYLIRGQQFDYKYHDWFVLGIEKELRITSLYEAYLFSMDERKIEPVPKVIQMYFQYESSLPYRKMAVLYNNIIAAKHSNKEVYQRYRCSMDRFAREQILAGHIDDSLAVIYNDILDAGELNEEIAKALSRILFTYRLMVYDEKMVRVWIYQRQMKEPQVVSITDHTAYVQLYSREYVIIFEDIYGQRYSGSIPFQLHGLMDASKYLYKCLELAPQELPFLVSYFDAKQSYLTFAKTDKEYLHCLFFSEHISSRYKARLLPEILRFYQMNFVEEKVDAYLLEADYASLDESTRKFAMELLVDGKLYDFAYEKVHEYGIDQMKPDSKASLADYMIEWMEFEEDETVLNMAFLAFDAKKHNERILEYLCRHYSGSTQNMLEIWLAAGAYEIDRIAISERILVQMMYAEHMVLEGMPVFCYFYENGGDDFVILAYISACAQYYFVENKKIHEDILRLIEARYIHHQEINDVCKLALLKAYAELVEVSKVQMQIEDELLAEFTRRNMHFAFYKRLHPQMLLKYHLYDKVFLEYRANPRSHVVLHYSRDEDGEDFIKEDMPNVYGGIFVKAFVMFFGETIQYYICEEHQNEVEVTESSRIINNDVYNRKDNSRYNLLNQMLISNTLKDEEELYRIMKKYAGYQEMTKKVFQLL